MSEQRDATDGCFDALVALVNRLREIHADDAYKSVWTINQLHAGPYTGPTYTAELEAAMVAIACAPSRNLEGVTGDEMDKGAERAALLTRLMAAGEPRETTLSEIAEPRGCPTPGACSCTRSATPLSTDERAELERLRSKPYYWAQNNGEIIEDSDRYRWFRDDCGLDQQAEIVEAAEGVADMLDHHIDKGRCGL